MAKSRPSRGDHQSEATDRTFVTLPEFTLFELNELKGVYAPTVPEVIKWIVQAWLHENQAEIEQRKKRHLEFRMSREAD